MDAVNHPAHYNRPGQKECIVQMEEKFGIEATSWFCLLNWFKYMYRYDLKNGVQDLQKATWYKHKFLSYGGNPDLLKNLPDDIVDHAKEDKDLHWIDDADRWRCPICGFETASPMLYVGCKCPKCGFQDKKDKVEHD